MSKSKQTCTFIKDNGKKCKNYRIKNSEKYCWIHSLLKPIKTTPWYLSREFAFILTAVSFLFGLISTYDIFFNGENPKLQGIENKIDGIEYKFQNTIYMLSNIESILSGELDNKEREQLLTYYYLGLGGKIDSALSLIQIFEEVTLKKKNNVLRDINFIKSHIFIYNTNYDSAETYLKRAIDYDSKFIAAYNDLGVTYLIRNKFISSKNMFETALKFDPGNAIITFNLIKLYEEQKNFSKVETLSRELIEKGTIDRDILLGIIEINLDLNNFVLVEPLLNSANQMYNNDAEVFYLNSLFWKKKGNLDFAYKAAYLSYLNYNDSGNNLEADSLSSSFFQNYSILKTIKDKFFYAKHLIILLISQNKKSEINAFIKSVKFDSRDWEELVLLLYQYYKSFDKKFAFKLKNEFEFWSSENLALLEFLEFWEENNKSIFDVELKLKSTLEKFPNLKKPLTIYNAHIALNKGEYGKALELFSNIRDSIDYYGLENESVINAYYHAIKVEQLLKTKDNKAISSFLDEINRTYQVSTYTPYHFEYTSDSTYQSSLPASFGEFIVELLSYDHDYYACSYFADIFMKDSVISPVEYHLTKAAIYTEWLLIDEALNHYKFLKDIYNTDSTSVSKWKIKTLYMNTVELYLGNKDTVKAISEIKIGIKLFPDYNPLKIKLLELENEIGQKELSKAEILKQFRLIEDIDQNEINKSSEYFILKSTLISLAESKMAHIKFNAEKLDIADILLQYDKNNISANVAYTNYYLDKNDFRSAEKYSDVLTDQCPNDENILYATSKIKTNLRKYSEGFELLSRIVSINPMNSNAYFDQSWLLYNNGQYEDAIGYFKHTLEIDPTKYYSYFFIADSYHKTKKYKEAINYYMKFIMIAKDKNGVDQRYLDWAEERIKELLKLTG